MHPEFADTPRLAPLTAEFAAELAAQRFGVRGAVRSLGSNEDQNFLVDVDGQRRLLKISHGGTTRPQLEAQNEALRILAQSPPAGLSVPSVVAGLDGQDIYAVEVCGETHHARMLDFLEGTPAGGRRALAAETAADLGRVAGTIVAALAGFEHVGLHSDGEWDLRQASRVVGAADELLGDAERAWRQELFQAAQQRLDSVQHALAVQALHGDLSTDNVVVDADGRVIGAIDFGDLAAGWRVAELAVAVASLLHHDGEDLSQALTCIRAFDAVCPLTDAEIVALWPLVVQRALVLVASAERIEADDPENVYAAARRPLERRILDRAAAVGAVEAELLIRDALGRLPELAVAPAAILANLENAVEVDLSVFSPAHNSGAWLDEGHSEAVLRDAWAARGPVVTRYGEYRLHPDAAGGGVPRSYALAVDAVVSAGTPLLSPADGVLDRTEDGRLALEVEDGLTIIIGGATAELSLPAPCAAGQHIATAVGDHGGALLSVQLSAGPGLRPPQFVTPGHESAWRRICPDPAPLLGRIAAANERRSSADLLGRRQGTFAPVQEHYYEDPPQIERGWRHHLIDVRGRGYLDMVNNVAILGHGDPRIADATAAQLRMLNTNSRFHYAALATFTEELTAHTPPGLDVVFLVNSGSEAVDLSIRLAKAATGRSDVLALTEAYHGWTVGADAISTSIGDNPFAVESRPEWVHLLPTPNAYRGEHRGRDAGRYLGDALAKLDQLDARGVSLAGVISEPVFGNGGGVLLPDGYLAGLWEAVRARGGVCVSDEVQVGYGRLGHHFWGFQQQGVVPDVIAVAKAMGNGHPLGAVITTSAIAEAFASEGSFFSSAGGSPVSCVVGTTVLRVLADDDLQANARETGDYLTARIRELCAKHPKLGTVHGMGLYLGIEIIGKDVDDPDGTAAFEICRDLLDEGIIVQPTGDHKNVLKIKPPLTLDRGAVDRFIAALDRVMIWRAAHELL
ncbi:MAG TPA: aminotransferase [Microbacterium sp.]|uniref:aminotransferase n=1 Tax=Microbacterium sp. TaxID=51671 RepID=UPI002CD8C182|nr:aminotransferase [Microbacterium sp.]HWI30052.1 aminotransferase [Microbacterium sp.]